MLRLLMLTAVAVGISTILRTGSRGALVAMALASLFFLLRGTARQRIALLAGAVVLIPVLVAAAPQESLQRITSFLDDVASGEEAAGSTEARKYLLRKSLEYTLHHPIFASARGNSPGPRGRATASVPPRMDVGKRPTIPICK